MRPAARLVRASRHNKDTIANGCGTPFSYRHIAITQNRQLTCSPEAQNLIVREAVLPRRRDAYYRVLQDPPHRTRTTEAPSRSYSAAVSYYLGERAEDGDARCSRGVHRDNTTAPPELVLPRRAPLDAPRATRRPRVHMRCRTSLALYETRRTATRLGITAPRSCPAEGARSRDRPAPLCYNPPRVRRRAHRDYRKATDLLQRITRASSPTRAIRDRARGRIAQIRSRPATSRHGDTSTMAAAVTTQGAGQHRRHVASSTTPRRCGRRRPPERRYPAVKGRRRS